MKNIFSLIACLLALAGTAQIPSWPPGGISPSPMIFDLPSNRYVPSTKRYNLVWGDQLYGLAASQIEFVAKNYVASQKIFSYQAADYRAHNPNFIVISYHLANGLNPQVNGDCPDPKNNTGNSIIGVIAPTGYVSEWDNYFLPWLGTNSVTVGSTRYEEMFQHYDVADNAHRVWHEDPFWAMNLTNTDWRTYMADACINWMSGNQNEGCFLDVSVETSVYLYNPKPGDPNPYNFYWYTSPHGPVGSTITSLGDFSTWMNDQYLNYYQYLYQRFHTATVDYLMIPNTDQMVTTWYDPIWLDGNSSGETIDGAMMEEFGNYTGGDMYLTLERGLRHLTGRGKIFIAQFTGSTNAERYRRAAMYMLIKNENSFLSIRPGLAGWWPEYEIDLGDQSALPANISSLRVSGSGSSSLFKRDYANGMVLCNTATSSTQYTLSGSNWTQVVTSGGGALNTNGTIASQSIQYNPVSGSINIGASDCIILKNMSGVGVGETATQQNPMIVYQNLSAGEVAVKISSLDNSPADIYITDIQGRKLQTIFSGNLSPGENEFSANISGLTSGIYFVVYKGETIQCEKIAK